MALASTLFFVGCDSTNDEENATDSTIYKLAPQSGTQSYTVYGETNHKSLGSIKNLSVIDGAKHQNKLLDKKNTSSVRYPLLTTNMEYNTTNNSYKDLHVAHTSYVVDGEPIILPLVNDGSSTPTEKANSNATNLNSISYKKFSYLGSNNILTAKDGNDNNKSVLITSDMDGATTPIDLDDKTILTLSYPSYGEPVNGYVVYDASEKQIQNCNTNLTTCTNIKEVNTTRIYYGRTLPNYYVYGDVSNSTLMAIKIDNELYKLDKSNNNLTMIENGSAISTNSHGGYTFHNDSIYYVADGNVTRTNISSGETYNIIADSESTKMLAFTNEWVIFGTDELMRAAKLDGSSSEAIELSKNTKTHGQKYPFDMGVGNQYLFTTFDIDTETGDTTYRACKFESGEVECKDKSFWSAITAAKNGTVNYKSSYPYTPYAYVRVDDTDNFGGGKLKAIDPTKPLEDGITMGEVAEFNFQAYMHNSSHGKELIDNNGSIVLYAKNDNDFRGNAYLVNLNKENSLVNLTNETAPSKDEINGNSAHCHGRSCMVCHNFAGGKIYKDKGGTKSAIGYNVKFEFEDGTDSLMGYIRKGQGENFNIPLKSLAGKKFKASVVTEDDNGTIYTKTAGYSHDGVAYANCNLCHARKGTTRFDAPNAITIEK